MGRIANALSTAGKVVETMAAHEAEVRNLTDKLMKHTYGVDRDQATEMARTLIRHAEPIKWK